MKLVARAPLQRDLGQDVVSKVAQHAAGVGHLRCATSSGRT